MTPPSGRKKKESLPGAPNEEQAFTVGHSSGSEKLVGLDGKPRSTRNDLFSQGALAKYERSDFAHRLEQSQVVITEPVEELPAHRAYPMQRRVLQLADEGDLLGEVLFGFPDCQLSAERMRFDKLVKWAKKHACQIESAVVAPSTSTEAKQLAYRRLCDAMIRWAIDHDAHLLYTQDQGISDAMARYREAEDTRRRITQENLGIKRAKYPEILTVSDPVKANPVLMNTGPDDRAMRYWVFNYMPGRQMVCNAPSMRHHFPKHGCPSLTS